MAEELDRVRGACEAYMASLQEGRFYDAHEDLEAIWFPRRFEENDEVKLWKGFINAAVSFELMKKGRNQTSETPWKTYTKYVALLEKIDTPHKELYVKMVTRIENKRGELCPSF